MELTLWRWSIGVQISSLAIIAAFFLVLQRSLPRDSIALWVRGWVFNFLALAAALLYWMTETTASGRAVAFFLFMATKSLAALYLVQGAGGFAPETPGRARGRPARTELLRRHRRTRSRGAAGRGPARGRPADVRGEGAPVSSGLTADQGGPFRPED